MSRIGNKPVVIPAGVTVDLKDNTVTVKGPKGELTYTFNQNISLEQREGEVVFTRPDDSKENKTIHGTTRAVFNNMVVGVTDGFQKELELIGVGYRAQLQGKKTCIKRWIFSSSGVHSRRRYRNRSSFKYKSNR